MGQCRPEQLWLLIEVSDKTLGLHTTFKARLYARAGITADEMIARLAAPQAELLVGDVFVS